MSNRKWSNGRSFHLFLGRLFLRAGNFLRAMAIMVMKPNDLIHFTRAMYQQPDAIAEWGNWSTVSSGLKTDEQQLYERLPLKQGRLLVLGLGGGREAIYFAKQGYTVSGIDYVPELVKIAEDHAREQGIALEGMVQDINELALAADHYDVIWFTRAIYSTLPTRYRRVQMLLRVREAMRPNGCIACQFYWDPGKLPDKKALRIRRLIAMLTCGNLAYEPGDTLWGGIEFSHAFTHEKEIRSEFAEADLIVENLSYSEISPRGTAILRKKQQPNKKVSAG